MSPYEFPPEQTFEYQLVRISYIHRTEYEDGPGSLRNVVSDEYYDAIREWTGNAAFGRHLLDSYMVNLPTDCDDDYGGTSYRLERRASENSPWKYVGHVAPYSQYDEHE